MMLHAVKSSAPRAPHHNTIDTGVVKNQLRSSAWRNIDGECDKRRGAALDTGYRANLWLRSAIRYDPALATFIKLLRWRRVVT